MKPSLFKNLLPFLILSALTPAAQSQETVFPVISHEDSCVGEIEGQEFKMEFVMKKIYDFDVDFSNFVRLSVAGAYIESQREDSLGKPAEFLGTLTNKAPGVVFDPYADTNIIFERGSAPGIRLYKEYSAENGLSYKLTINDDGGNGLIFSPEYNVDFREVPVVCDFEVPEEN